MQKKLILIADESPSVLNLLSSAMSGGFKVDAISELGVAAAAIRSGGHDAIILNVSMSAQGLDGLGLIASLRREEDERPIVAISGNSELSLPSRSYDAGADAYLQMPFRSIAEIASLLTRLLTCRRLQANPRMNGVLLPSKSFRLVGSIIHPDLTVELPDGHRAAIGPKMAGLLYLISTHRGQLLTRKTVLSEVWGHGASLSGKSLDTYLVRLRRLFREHQGDLASVLSPLPGVGWRVSES